MFNIFLLSSSNNKPVWHSVQILKSVLYSFSCFTSQESSSKCFGSSKTSRISFVDLAGFERNVLDGATKEHVKEEKYIKKSMSQLGYVQWISVMSHPLILLILVIFSIYGFLILSISFHLSHLTFPYIVILHYPLNQLTAINWKLYYPSCLGQKQLVPQVRSFLEDFIGVKI